MKRKDAQTTSGSASERRKPAVQELAQRLGSAVVALQDSSSDVDSESRITTEVSGEVEAVPPRRRVTVSTPPARRDYGEPDIIPTPPGNHAALTAFLVEALRERDALVDYTNYRAQPQS